ncbi:MAG: response regulator [candidate division Zixibacteria bacterium]|nr:response regulator [candidate division Zixibacteria bacterium]NIS16619.1 response regulator [candidate division Zixibacteria bacterium]NIS47566.1 response regulator [candidate division Zixibacteria bacterium]NIT52986.1 response regulator [candidate division Zixibacteria bacterium]NIU15653.1 response regulator [candidate division Zixibacteria bacterium]
MSLPGNDNGGNNNPSDKRTILIVDDNSLMLQTLDAILNEDFDILFAKTGQESIDIVKANRQISCILMDIRLPDISGIIASREIYKINPTLPVVFHTGHPGEYYESHLMDEKNAYGYVTKGDSISELVETIDGASKSMQ